MIPKVIHYCWFGRNPLPLSAKRCIESWMKFFPDYEIKEWNEDNFDINIIPFTQEAYSVGKYAYVSDYARLWVLYNNGGVYFDTDVEVIKNMAPVISQGPYMGIEKNTKSANVSVNPGIGFAAEKNDAVLRNIMQYYENEHFIVDGNIKQITIVPITTNVLVKYGFNRKNEIQKVGNFRIYPYDYFCPIEYPMGKLEKTSNTVSIHYYSESWLSKKDKIKIRLFTLLETKHGKKIKRILKFMFGKN